MRHDEDLLTPAEVARKLKISVSTLRRYRESGKLPYKQLTSRTYRYPERDVQAFIDSTDAPRDLL